jgi:DNA-binding transcriptional MerR regulator
MIYTVNKLAVIAGISVRTLHFYDRIGLLKPRSYSQSGYRYYGEEESLRLQQIMFFRELGFSLSDIGKTLSDRSFNAVEALKTHRKLLQQKAERLAELVNTIDRTIEKLERKREMDIKEFYKGFSEDKIEEYREEVRRRWGDKALRDSEQRVLGLGKEKMVGLQAKGGQIFQALADAIAQGKPPESDAAQAQVERWRQWLEHFHHYSPEALLGLGQMYSQDPRFAAFFEKYHKDLPAFFTRAVELYCSEK